MLELTGAKLAKDRIEHEEYGNHHGGQDSDGTELNRYVGVSYGRR